LFFEFHFVIIVCRVNGLIGLPYVPILRTQYPYLSKASSGLPFYMINAPTAQPIAPT